MLVGTLACAAVLHPRCPSPQLSAAPLRAVVVGGGPAGGAAALALHKLGWSVKLFERRPDWEEGDDGSAWSVTLTKRAFDTLESLEVDCDELEGVPLEARVIMGAAKGSKPIISPFQFRNINLSTRRIAKLVTRTARERGIECAFEHECLGVEPGASSTRVRFLRSDGIVTHEEADLVVGADGANSAVRAALQRSAFGFEVSQDFEGSPQFRIATVTIDDTEHRLPRGRAALDGVSESGELLSVGDAIYTSFASDVGVILSPNVDSTVSIVATETLFEGLALDADSAAVDEALRASAPNLASFLRKVHPTCPP